MSRVSLGLTAARTAEWNKQLTDRELDQLVVAYGKRVRRQYVVEDVLPMRVHG